MVLTELTEKSIWDIKLWSIDLNGKMSHKIGLGLPFSTLKSSMAGDWMFPWWVLKELSFFSKSANEVM